mmetsp:Transcript_16322/g.37261  ORF Transcript_16322/g.37261 Transcript_16322/m.37261 type:complete len:412 (-) Transcript_16322:30-1265(-)
MGAASSIETSEDGMLVESFRCHGCDYKWNQKADLEHECPSCGGDFVERTSVGIMQNRPRRLPINEEAIQQAVAAAMAAGGGENQLSVQELMLNIAQFGLSADEGMSHENNPDDPELREAIERSLAETEGNPRLPPPASQKAMESLKTTRYAGEMMQRQEAACAVCSEEYKHGEDLLSMPCEHVFHKACLLPWLKSTNSCPVCRMTLETDDAAYERTRVKQTKVASNAGNKVNMSHKVSPRGGSSPEVPPGAPQAVEAPPPPPGGQSRASISSDSAARRMASNSAPRPAPSSISAALVPPSRTHSSASASASSSSFTPSPSFSSSFSSRTSAAAAPGRQSTIERLMAREVPRPVASPPPRLSGRTETQSLSSSRVVAHRRAAGRLQGEREATKQSFSRGSSSGSNGRMEKQR